MARQHAGTINPRYLAPPTAVLAMVAGALAGIAGLAACGAGRGGSRRRGGGRVRSRRCTGRDSAWPRWPRGCCAAVAGPGSAVLAALHIAWGVGFLTSPRSLIPGHVPATPPTARLARGRLGPARRRSVSATSRSAG